MGQLVVVVQNVAVQNNTLNLAMVTRVKESVRPFDTPENVLAMKNTILRYVHFQGANYQGGAVRVNDVFGKEITKAHSEADYIAFELPPGGDTRFPLVYRHMVYQLIMYRRNPPDALNTAAIQVTLLIQ